MRSNCPPFDDSIKISASSISLRSASRPLGFRSLRATARQFLRSPSHCQLGVPRVKSGASAFSTHTTSAPYSAKIVAMKGPASDDDALTTFKSERVPKSGLFSFFHTFSPFFVPFVLLTESAASNQLRAFSNFSEFESQGAIWFFSSTFCIRNQVVFRQTVRDWLLKV